MKKNEDRQKILECFTTNIVKKHLYQEKLWKLLNDIDKFSLLFLEFITVLTVLTF